jgi:hypothetical protein
MGILDLFKPNSESIGGAVESVGNLAKTIKTVVTGKVDPQVELEIEKALLTEQMKVNALEAQNTKLFIAGWRPFIGWVCGIAIAYAFLLKPVVTGIINFWKPEFTMPEVDTNSLYPLLMGMLGIAGMRTFEKVKGTQNKH